MQLPIQLLSFSSHTSSSDMYIRNDKVFLWLDEFLQISYQILSFTNIYLKLYLLTI